MSDLNVFSFTGRLTKDAEVRTIGSSGKKVTTSNVAINTGFGDYKKVLFVKVQMWGDKGEKIAQYLKKGKMITASGELSRNEWGEEGNKKVDFVVDSQNIQLLPDGKKQDSETEGQEEFAF